MRQPLSSVQQRIWFHDQLNPDRVAYNVPELYRLAQPLAIPTLRRALSAVASKHALLRARFATDEQGSPFYEVDTATDAPEVPVEHRECADDPPTELLNQWFARPFDLASQPPMRCLTVTTPDHDYLALAVHHLACDAESMNQIVSDSHTAIARPHKRRTGLASLLLQIFNPIASWRPRTAKAAIS